MRTPRLSWRTLLSLPGRWADRLWGTKPLQLPTPPQETIIDTIDASPRANGYLSLEPELQLIQCKQGLLSVQSQGQNAFIVGGYHGPQEHLTQSLQDFIAQAKAQSHKRVLLFPIAKQEKQAVEQAGIRCLQVGSEAFLNPTQFTMKGKKMADLRQMFNRATKRYQLTSRWLDPVQDRHLIEHTYQEWLSHRPEGHKMSLLIGTPNLQMPGHRRYLGAFSPESSMPVAVVSITPGWSQEGWGVDVMARCPHAPAGTMEFLFVSCIQQLAEEGVKRFSLGACPMAFIPEATHPLPLHLRWIFHTLYHSALGNQLFRFRSLVYFKNKFRPQWEPVYIGGYPNIGMWSLYVGCHMWGMFGEHTLGTPLPQPQQNTAFISIIQDNPKETNQSK